MQLKEGWLVSRDKAGATGTWCAPPSWILSAFDIQRNQALLASKLPSSDHLPRLYPGAELLRCGTLFYSQHASNLAWQQDIPHHRAGLHGRVILLIWGVSCPTRALLLSPPHWRRLMGAGHSAHPVQRSMFLTLVISSSPSVSPSITPSTSCASGGCNGDDETPHQTSARLPPSPSGGAADHPDRLWPAWFALPRWAAAAGGVCALAGLFSAFITVLCLFPRWAALPTRLPWGIQLLVDGWLLALGSARWCRHRSAASAAVCCWRPWHQPVAGG